MNAVLRMIVVGIFSLWLSGCIPIRTPTVTSGPKSFKGDLSFIQDGFTARQEIEERLGWADTHVHDPRLFLGHWGISSAGFIEGGGGERLWGGRTVMIEFDDAGRVQAHRVVDDRHCMEELAAWMERAHYPPLNLLQPYVEGLREGRVSGWRLGESKYLIHAKAVRLKSAAENGRYKLTSRRISLPFDELDVDGDGMIKVVRYLQQTGKLRSTH
jgi:hypothetical protein